MSANPHRFLLLDPNFVTRIALTSRLEASGYMVRAEKAVSTAARVANSANWDLIVISASLPAADLEAFLETLALTENPACRCVVVEPDDQARREVAERFQARTLVHPVRPNLLSDLLAGRDSSSEGRTAPPAFFRTA